MFFEILSRGNGVTKGVVGLMAAGTALFAIGASSPNKPRTLTSEWREAEKKYRVAQNISER